MKKIDEPGKLRKLSLRDYAQLAEVVSAIAVVISLIFVGVQVRQSAEETSLNTNALYINAYQDLVSQFNGTATTIVANPELSELVQRINAGGEYQNMTEQSRYTTILYQIFRQGDLAYRQYENSLIDEETLRSALRIVRINTISKRGRPIWELFTAGLGNPRYREFVNSMPARCPSFYECGDEVPE